MDRKTYKWLLVSALLTCGGLPAAADETKADPQLTSIIAADHRTPKYAARDGFRHPYKTLTFFGLKPDMSVVEIWPGGGWYTEILAPYLNERGKYYAAHRNRDTENTRILAGIKRYDAKLAAHTKTLWQGCRHRAVETENGHRPARLRRHGSHLP